MSHTTLKDLAGNLRGNFYQTRQNKYQKTFCVVGPIWLCSSIKMIFKQFNLEVFSEANFESIEIELAGRGGGSSQTSNYFLIDRIDV